jgi:hypothetical protein
VSIRNEIKIFRAIEHKYATFLDTHQVIDSDFVVVKVQSRYGHLFLLLLQHFPDKAALIEVVLHLLVHRVDKHLIDLVALEALEAEHVKENDRVLVATGRKNKCYHIILI